jgi:transposase
MRDISKETDVNLLQQAVRLLEHENRRLVGQIGALAKQVAELQKSENPGLDVQLKLAAVEQHLAKLQKMVFGPKSERTKRAENTEDGASDGAVSEQEAASTENAGPEEKESKPARKSAARRSQSKLSKVVVKHPVPASAMTCVTCGSALVNWEGQFDSSQEIYTLRRAFVMVEHHQLKARCPNGCGAATARAPRKLFPGARYSIGFALEVAIDKYLHHLPLARQVRQMAAAGLEMDTQTLWDQLNRLASLLQPLYLRILRYIYEHRVIGADETKWRMMNEGERLKHNKNKSWQVWTLAAPRAVYYEIHDGRGLNVAESVLGTYQGTIVCDGYAVYEALAKKYGHIELAFCWAHTRRNFADIAAFFPSEVKAIVALIDRLFEIDRQVPGDDEAALKQRALRRSELSRPVIAEIERWAREVKTLPGNGLDSAIKYMTNHWTGLLRFLNNPAIPLSNNITERANRAPVLGRKNHYGSRSVRGTVVAAQLYTILETAKLNSVDPFAYLELAVDAALEGTDIPLPHECTDAVAARADDNIRRFAVRARSPAS